MKVSIKKPEVQRTEPKNRHVNFMIKKGHDIYQGTLDDLVVAHKNKSLEDIFIEMTHEE